MSLILFRFPRNAFAGSHHRSKHVSGHGALKVPGSTLGQLMNSDTLALGRTQGHATRKPGKPFSATGYLGRTPVGCDRGEPFTADTGSSQVTTGHTPRLFRGVLASQAKHCRSGTMGLTDGHGHPHPPGKWGEETGVAQHGREVCVTTAVPLSREMLLCLPV